MTWENRKIPITLGTVFVLLFAIMLYGAIGPGSEQQARQRHCRDLAAQVADGTLPLAEYMATRCRATFLQE